MTNVTRRTFFLIECVENTLQYDEKVEKEKWKGENFEFFQSHQNRPMNIH